LLSIVINRDFWLRFLLHKKALKSFLHSLTICDKVASGNKKKKARTLSYIWQHLSLVSIMCYVVNLFNFLRRESDVWHSN
jgi:hypothetical protein